MTLLRTVSTLSVSDFAAYMEAAISNSPTPTGAPLTSCPRSKSPELRGAPLRRCSKAPSTPLLRTPSPSQLQRTHRGLSFYSDDDDESDDDESDAESSTGRHICLERCTGSPSPRSHSPRSHGSATPSLSYASSDDDDDDDDEDEEEQDDDDDSMGDSDGIVWFGRRQPVSDERVTLFYAWVSRNHHNLDADDNNNGHDGVGSGGNGSSHNARRAAMLATVSAASGGLGPSNSTSSAAAARTHLLWTRLALLWRIRRHRSLKAGPSVGASAGGASAGTAKSMSTTVAMRTAAVTASGGWPM